MDVFDARAGLCPDDVEAARNGDGKRKPPHESWRRSRSAKRTSPRQRVVAMCGLYLVAAELSRRGFIVSPPTSPDMGLLAMCRDSEDAFLVSVSAKTGGDSSWRLGECRHDPQVARCVHVFVDIATAGDGELFAVTGIEMAALVAMPECADGRVREAALRRYGGGSAEQAFAVRA